MTNNLRQSNTLQCLQSCPNRTITSKQSVTSIRRRNPSLCGAKTFSNPRKRNGYYAKRKNGLSPTLKPSRQEPVKQAGEIAFQFSRRFDVLFNEREVVAFFPERFAPGPFPFSAVCVLSFHLKKYVSFCLPCHENIRILSSMQEENFDKRKMPVAKQAAILASLCEGTPINAVARIFRTEKCIITCMIRETGEAFADYMDQNFRDLPCLRIEMDEQWQYVGAHAGRLPKDDQTERGDYWLWAAIDADTKLVFSHKIGKRDWITGYEFVGNVKLA
jgi:hypothetical protein